MTEPDAATTPAPAPTPQIDRLILLGRDREAAELANATYAAIGHHRHTTRRGSTMDVFSQFDELGPLLIGVVSNIDVGQLDDATPCANLTVGGILEHMVGGAAVFAAAFEGREADQPETTDVLAAFGPALGGLADAIHGDGALDRTIHAPFGDVDGTTFGRFVVLDGLVHGWDLATSTGQPYQPPDALVAEVEAFAREAVPPMRDGDTFADATEPPSDATPIERLAAFTGRTV